MHACMIVCVVCACVWELYTLHTYSCHVYTIHPIKFQWFAVKDLTVNRVCSDTQNSILSLSRSFPSKINCKITTMTTRRIGSWIIFGRKRNSNYEFLKTTRQQQRRRWGRRFKLVGVCMCMCVVKPSYYRIHKVIATIPSPPFIRTEHKHIHSYADYVNFHRLLNIAIETK